MGGGAGNETAYGIARDRGSVTNKIRIREHPMASIDEQILRAAKEIAVKFIETGRISPTNFPKNFQTIYETVRSAVKNHDTEPRPSSDNPDTKE